MQNQTVHIYSRMDYPSGKISNKCDSIFGTDGRQNIYHRYKKGRNGATQIKLFDPDEPDESTAELTATTTKATSR